MIKTFLKKSEPKDSVNSAIDNLSWVTACEAGPAETIGANRQVAWSVRQRVNLGSTRVNNEICLSVDNSGAETNINQGYANIICQPDQYVGVRCNSSKNVFECSNLNIRDADSDQVSVDVYNGFVPGRWIII